MLNILSCSSAGIANILKVLHNIFKLIWIVTPILSIIFLAVNLTKIVLNPDEKKLTKRLYNQLLALIIVFMIPTIVNAFMLMLGSSTDISSCWKEATSSTTLKETSSYQEPVSNVPKGKIIENPKDYDYGNKRASNSNNSSSASNNTSLNNLFAAAKQADQHTYNNGYHYGNALSWDGTNMKDQNGNTVSCDRGVGLTLYYAGLTKTDPNKLTLNVLSNELGNRGWKKITNYNDLQPGDIVFYDRQHNGSLEHTFLIGEKINKRYDWGSNDRIKHRGPYSSGMPFTEGISSQAFYYAYRMP